MMQTQQPGRRPQYTGTMQCIRSIVARESVAGLYRGLSSPLGGVALVNSVVFGVYGNVQKRSSAPDSLRTHCFAGTLAGLTQSLITSPMELTKTRMQMQSAASTPSPAGSAAPHYRGAIDCARRIHGAEGWRGLYRGFSITAVRDVPGFASYFVLYELLVRAGRTPDQTAGTAQTLLAGGLAGVGSWILTMPIDVVKTRLQVDGTVPGQPTRYAGIADCALQSWRAEGWRFMTRGMSSTLLRAFLMNSVCFYVVAFVMNACDDEGRTAVAVVEPMAQQLAAGYREPEPQALRQMLTVDGGWTTTGRRTSANKPTDMAADTKSRPLSAPLGRSNIFWSALGDAIDEQDIADMDDDWFGRTETSKADIAGYINVTGELLEAYDHSTIIGASDLGADDHLRIRSE